MSPVRLMWANLHRRPLRTYLTLFSIFVAFLLFTLLRTAAAYFAGGGATAEGADRLVTTAKYSIIEMLPISQRQEIMGVDGVEAATHQTWFGGNYQDPGNFFPKFPVEPVAFFDMYPEMAIAPAQLEAFARTRTGAVAAASLAAQFGWEIGDKIPIEADIWPQRDGNRLWEFDLVGTYTMPNDDIEQRQFLFHYDFFDEARQFSEGTIGWWTIRIADPARAPEIAGAIDALFENSLNPTKTATEDEFARAFGAQIGNIGLIVGGILSAVFFTILLLTGVVMGQALRERLPELAVLKTLGFTDGAVALLVLGESVLLCALGGFLGIGITLLVAPLLNDILASVGFGPFVLSPPTIGTAAAIAVALGLVVGVVPALQARALTIAEALRRS